MLSLRRIGVHTIVHKSSFNRITLDGLSDQILCNWLLLLLCRHIITKCNYFVGAGNNNFPVDFSQRKNVTS